MRTRFSLIVQALGKVLHFLSYELHLDCIGQEKVQVSSDGLRLACTPT